MTPTPQGTPGPPTFPNGARVQLHPATDAWMMGDKYGTVVHTTRSRLVPKGREIVHVLMDRSNKVRKLTVEFLEQI